jgi:hypothetical protein
MDTLKDILARWQLIRLKHLLQAANQNQNHNVLLYAEIEACKEFLEFAGRAAECAEVVRKFPITR